MAALSTGESPRDIIFQQAIKQPYKTTVYFRQVYLLVKKLGFEYARGFQLVANKAGAHTVKNLLLRFAGSISSGESEQEFLAQEARVEREQYVNRYQRSLETLQKWSDAYAALMVSTTLIVVVSMISTMIYNMGGGFVYILSGTMYIMSFFGAWIMYKIAPYEITPYKNHRGPKERRRAMFLFLTLGPVGVVASIYLGVTSGLGMGFLALGVCIMPAGVFAYMDDMNVAKIDEEMSTFIRSLGNVSESLGTTLTIAMGKIDRRSLGALQPHVKRLQSRLRSQINSRLCWDRFVDETGSELSHRTTNMFVDGMSLGGSPAKVGTIASDYAMTIAPLRAKRNVAATPFAYLTIPLHGAMSALLIFVLSIMTAFSGKMGEATDALGEGGASVAARIPNMAVFQAQDMSETATLTLGAVFVLTIANALAAQFATGGHPLKLLFFGGILTIISGLNLLLIPPVAQGLLK